MSIIKGLSVYAGLKDYSFADNLIYLKEAKEAGIDFFFSSCHIQEAKLNDDFYTILKYCTEIGMQLVVDVNKTAYDTIKEFKDFIVFRLDYGFTIEEVVELSNSYDLIELNASCLTKDYLERLKALNANFSHIRVSYNFYPKRYTGFDIYKILELNNLYKEYGLQILAYLPSNSGKRPPLYDGLPSVERHRYLDLKTACYELIAVGCDGLCIGDAYASSEDINTLVNISSTYFELPIVLFDNLNNEIDIIKSDHRLRIDESCYMKRSSSKRGEEVFPLNTISLIKPYMVTIDNINYQRYKGELGIAVKEMENDGKVNVVGYILESAHTLVDLIKPSSKIKFNIIKYINFNKE